MASAAILLILVVLMLLVPDLRAQPSTWVVAGVLTAIAVVMLLVGQRGSKSIRTARQMKYTSWWGYTSHDGSGETDIHEKLGE